MRRLILTPVTFVWLLLMAATGVSMWATAEHGVDGYAVATAVVMIVALFKVYFVGMFFMELRHAPIPLHAAFDVWCALCGAAVLGVYFLG